MTFPWPGRPLDSIRRICTRSVQVVCKGLHSPKAEFSCGQVHGDELFGWTSNRRIHRIGNLSGYLNFVAPGGSRRFFATQMVFLHFAPMSWFT